MPQSKQHKPRKTPECGRKSTLSVCRSSLRAFVRTLVRGWRLRMRKGRTMIASIRWECSRLCHNLFSGHPGKVHTKLVGKTSVFMYHRCETCGKICE